MQRFTLVAATLVLLVPAVARAQETPTERDAARTVVQKQLDLQRSLNGIILRMLMSWLERLCAAKPYGAERGKSPNVYGAGFVKAAWAGPQVTPRSLETCIRMALPALATE